MSLADDFLNDFNEDQQAQKVFISNCFGGYATLIDKGTRTASGETDDQITDEPSQVEQMQGAVTDARDIANVVFVPSNVRIPAEIIAMGDVYDMTQSLTRLTKLYNSTRKNLYQQSASAATVRETRLEYKQELIAEIVRQSEQPKMLQSIEYRQG